MSTDENVRRRMRPLDLAAIVSTASQLAFAAWIWRSGPAGPIPMHFDFQGHVNRWGDRHEAALLVAGTAAGMAVLYVLLPALAAARPERDGARRGLSYARVLVLLAPLLVTGLMASTVFAGAGASEASRPQVTMAGVSLLMAVVGGVLGKVSPNPFVGVRTYWSLRSRLAWDKSNRLAGRLLLGIGVAGLIAAPLAPQPQAFTTLIVAILGAAAVSVFESWRVWRDDPDRGATA